jgi:prepilin-type processing-associated H-X9-DG protein
VLAGGIGNARAFRCPADGKGYFENEGSSYEYSTRLAGRKVLTGRGNRPQNTTTIPVFYDYEDFHGGIGTPGSRNFIYADGHVGSSHGVPPPSEDNSP